MNPGLDRLYPGDCQAAWPLAQQLMAEEGPRLASTGLLQEVSRLVSLAEELESRMSEPNRVCAACGARPDGGCCSQAIADEADAILLLLNLIAGLKLDKPPAGTSLACPFLGQDGCRLLFKPIFCLNYDCARLKGGCDPEQFARYQRQRALLLQGQWRLECLLLDHLRTQRCPV